MAEFDVGRFCFAGGREMAGVDRDVGSDGADQVPPGIEDLDMLERWD